MAPCRAHVHVAAGWRSKQHTSGIHPTETCQAGVSLQNYLLTAAQTQPTHSSTMFCCTAALLSDSGVVWFGGCGQVDQAGQLCMLCMTVHGMPFSTL